jgi:hypothetical protein
MYHAVVIAHQQTHRFRHEINFVNDRDHALPIANHLI